MDTYGRYSKITIKHPPYWGLLSWSVKRRCVVIKPVFSHFGQHRYRLACESKQSGICCPESMICLFSKNSNL